MRDPANAQSLTNQVNHRILALGPTGSGKTTQLLTLPRPVFAYIFDPNASLSLRGQDIDYLEFLPAHLPMAVRPTAKDAKKDASTAPVAEAYRAFEQDFDQRLREGFFDKYNTIAMDSVTTLLDLIMDRVLQLNGRAGQWPEMQDYPSQMMAFMSICRTLTGLGKTIYMTGHLLTDKDELTQRIYRQPLMTGRLREKIPLLFSDVLVCDVLVDKDNQVSYRVQTVPDRLTPSVRTCIKGLEAFEPVTIDWTKPVIGQGLGGILNWESRQLKENAAKSSTGTR